MVVNPKKILYTVANPAEPRYLLNRGEKKKKKKSNKLMSKITIQPVVTR